MIGEIVKKKGADIMKEADQEGWTPLHYATHIGRLNATKLLLKLDRNLAYMKDKEGRIALHIVADGFYANKEIIKEIVSRCPDCCEIVDNGGRNVFHYISVNKNSDQNDMGDIFGGDWSFSNLLNEKDAYGNAPIHLYSNSLVTSEFLLHHPRVDKMAFNKQNMDAYHIALTGEILPESKRDKIVSVRHGPRRVLIPKDVQNKINKKVKDEKKKEATEAEKRLKKAEDVMVREKAEEEYNRTFKEAAPAHLVVATLIATVTFTAGITMPGGYLDKDGRHPGTPILAGNAAFRAFIIFNTIAMVLSSCAVFAHLIFPLLFEKDVHPDVRTIFFVKAFSLILIAMGTMMLAFITSTYAVLAHSLGLAIPTCLIGLCFFFLAPYIFFKLIKQKDHWRRD